MAAASAHPGSRGELGARRRSHGAAEGAAPSAGHSGLAPRLPPHPLRLAVLLLLRGWPFPPPDRGPPRCASLLRLADQRLRQSLR